MFAKKLGATVTLTAFITAALWLAGGQAAAAPSPVRLTPVPPAQQQPGKPVTLGVKVVDSATSRALGGIPVRFFIMTDVFGARLMEIGQVPTDASGAAYVLYKPSWEGDTKVVARFLGNSEYGAGESTYQFSAVGPVPVHENASFGLKPIRAVAPWVVFAIIGGVWATLVFVLVSTVRGISVVEVRVPGRATAVPGGTAGQTIEP